MGKICGHRFKHFDGHHSHQYRNKHNFILFKFSTFILIADGQNGEQSHVRCACNSREFDHEIAAIRFGFAEICRYGTTSRGHRDVGSVDVSTSHLLNCESNSPESRRSCHGPLDSTGYHWLDQAEAPMTRNVISFLRKRERKRTMSSSCAALPAGQPMDTTDRGSRDVLRRFHHFHGVAAAVAAARNAAPRADGDDRARPNPQQRFPRPRQADHASRRRGWYGVFRAHDMFC